MSGAQTYQLGELFPHDLWQPSIVTPVTPSSLFRTVCDLNVPGVYDPECWTSFRASLRRAPPAGLNLLDRLLWWAAEGEYERNSGPLEMALEVVEVCRLLADDIAAWFSSGVVEEDERPYVESLVYILEEYTHTARLQIERGLLDRAGLPVCRCPFHDEDWVGS